MTGGEAGLVQDARALLDKIGTSQTMELLVAALVVKVLDIHLALERLEDFLEERAGG